MLRYIISLFLLFVFAFGFSQEKKTDTPEIAKDSIIYKTNYGLRIKTFRNLNNGSTHARITNQIFPCAISIPMSNSMTITQWHVPVDDENCYWYAIKSVCRFRIVLL